jgi:integrase
VTGETVRKQTQTYYGRLPGQRKPVSLKTRNRKVAELLLAEKVLEAERGDPYAVHAKRILLEHVGDWLQSLLDKGTGAERVERVVTRAECVLAGCHLDYISDIAASKVQRWLKWFAAAGEVPQLPDGVEAWTKHELAKIIGVTTGSILATVRRHRLPVLLAKGARRYPRETAERLVAIHARGRCQQTINGYLGAIKQFIRWMVDDRRMRDNPLGSLKRGNPELDARHDRRPLSLPELQAVLGAARASSKKFRGLTGEDRHALYLASCCTGFRRSELAELVPESFDLDSDPPLVTLPRRDTKNRRGAVQPLPADVVLVLRDYLRGRDAQKPIWPGKWRDRAAEMLHADLDAAGIPFVIQGPDGPLFADFHALRHSYVALLDQAGATLRQAMQLARHTDPKLTMRRYGRAHIRDLAACVNRLPSVCSPLALSCAAPASAGDSGRPEDPATTLPFPQGKNHAQRTPTCAGDQVPPAGIEPATLALGTTRDNGAPPQKNQGAAIDRSSLAEILAQAGVPGPLIDAVLAMARTEPMPETRRVA